MQHKLLLMVYKCGRIYGTNSKSYTANNPSKTLYPAHSTLSAIFPCNVSSDLIGCLQESNVMSAPVRDAIGSGLSTRAAAAASSALAVSFNRDPPVTSSCSPACCCCSATGLWSACTASCFCMLILAASLDCSAWDLLALVSTVPTAGADHPALLLEKDLRSPEWGF